MGSTTVLLCTMYVRVSRYAINIGLKHALYKYIVRWRAKKAMIT